MESAPGWLGGPKRDCLGEGPIAAGPGSAGMRDGHFPWAGLVRRCQQCRIPAVQCSAMWECTAVQLHCHALLHRRLRFMHHSTKPADGRAQRKSPATGQTGDSHSTERRGKGARQTAMQGVNAIGVVGHPGRGSGDIVRVPEQSIGSPDREVCSSEGLFHAAEAATGDSRIQVPHGIDKVVRDFRVIRGLRDLRRDPETAEERWISQGGMVTACKWSARGVPWPAGRQGRRCPTGHLGPTPE
jgi:hypothetical protein